MNCYRCDIELTRENESVEHIIPNAIGGKLKSRKLLCKKCNSILGDLYDSELSKKLNEISSFLNIKREKGIHPDIKNVKSKSGKTFTLKNGIRPVPIAPEIDINKEGNTFSVSARDEKEMRHILKQLKKKYPTIDENVIDGKLIKEKYYLNEPLHMKMNVGGKEFMKAIVKIAINFYLNKTGKREDVAVRIKDLINQNELDDYVIKHYYKEDIVELGDEWEIAHAIYVKGDAKCNSLFAFIELFSSYAFIVKLNTQYTGPDLTYSYSYDVLKNIEISKEINIEYSQIQNEENDQAFEKGISILTKKISRVMAIGDSRQVDSIINDITNKAMAKIMGTGAEGKMMDEESINEFFKTVAHDAAPFIQHMRNKRGLDSNDIPGANE